MILHVNAAGSRVNLNSLHELVEESSFHQPDVICVSETERPEFDLNGFTRYSFPRAGLNQKYRKGKRVAIFVNSYYFLHARELLIYHFLATNMTMLGQICMWR